MRKQTKLVAVLSAAALLAIGASMTSFAAAKGWTEENGEWVWLDSDGERVYNTWKKSGDNYYWLDEDGVMATNRLINEDDEAIYYVNEYGARVKNTWVSLENVDDEVVNNSYTDAEIPETLWYFFGSNGKAYRSDGANGENWVKKTVDYAGGSGYFFFNSVGQMGSGWIEYKGETYYCGDENQGYAHTWWQYLEPNADMVSGDYDDQEWFYFGGKGGNGKMTKAKDGKEYVTKYIDNRYYTFNQDGVLATDWYDGTIGTGANAGKATGANVDAYANESGALGTGWVYTTREGKNDDEEKWYYLVTIDIDGVRRAVPFNSLPSKENGEEGYRAKVIKGKTYLFNADGIMQTGLVTLGDDKVPVDFDANKYTKNKTTPVFWNGIVSKMIAPGTYYFEKGGYTSTAGQMKTGKVTVTEEGESSYYYFSKEDGRAITSEVKDGVVYGEDGKRIQAEDGNTNEVKTAAETIFKGDKEYIPQGSKFIVSSTGKLRTSGKVTIDGVKYTIENGVINPAKTEYVQ